MNNEELLEAVIADLRSRWRENLGEASACMSRGDKDEANRYGDRADGLLQGIEIVNRRLREMREQPQNPLWHVSRETDPQVIRDRIADTMRHPLDMD